MELHALVAFGFCGVAAAVAAVCAPASAGEAVGTLVTAQGQPSYSLSNKTVSVLVTVQGGHLTADFLSGNTTVSPFYVAPWWNEAVPEDVPPLLKVLRGDFLCFPMGDNKEPYEGRRYPPHGQTANDDWSFVRGEANGEDSELELTMRLADGEGTVNKVIRITEGEPVIYCKHVVKGFAGKTSLGHHPNLQFPDREGAGYIDMTKPLAGFTAPIPFELPEKRGYSALKTNAEITDRTKAPCANGDTWDLTRYPTPKGFEDLALFISDPSKEFVFSAVSLPESGYLYFQLKDPRVLSETLLWMSNGGRHYAPWNGRNIAVLGLEEITAYFAYGRTQSVQPNPLLEKGFKTYVDIGGEKPFVVKLIMGALPINRDFRGVEDIVRKDASTIEIRGKGGERIAVPCRADFLKE